MGNMNYSKDFTKIMALSDQLENRTDIMHSLESWAKPFHEFVRVHYYIDIMETELSDDLWKTYLSKFLYSNAGGKYQANFKFNQKLQCGQPTGNITVSYFYGILAPRQQITLNFRLRWPHLTLNLKHFMIENSIYLLRKPWKNL